MELKFLLICLLVFVISIFCTKLLVNILPKYKLVDVPNARSNHKKNIPRGGGIAIIASFTVAYVAYCLFYNQNVSYNFILPALALGFISFADDIKSLSAGFRLFIHFIASYFAVYYLPDQRVTFFGTFPLEIDRFIAMIMLVYFFNIFNFMDGLDGMASSNTIFIALALSLCYYFIPIQSNIPQIMMMLIAATLGFAVFNWHPAKIFLGDVGSIFLGYVIGYHLWLFSLDYNLATVLMIPMYFLLDSGITIIRRIIRREKIWTPHSKHFCQIAVRAGLKHSQVVVRIIILNLMLLPLILLSLNSFPKLKILTFVLSVSFVLVFLISFVYIDKKARKKNEVP